MQKLNFKDFSTEVESQFNKMAADQSIILFRTKNTPDEMWKDYLNAYPVEVNGIFRERQNYDCNCCKNFVRRIGNVIGVDANGNISSVWDVKVPGYFQAVADKLASIVKSQRIDNVFLTSEKIAGSLSNIDNYDENIKWDHFYAKVPDSLVLKSDSIGSALGENTANYSVLKRSMEELSIDAIDTVLELIEQDTIYRGQEHLQTVKLLKQTKNEYDKVENKDLFLWVTSYKLKHGSRFKNTVIGTLIVDISEGVEIEKAIASFESKVAPTNYKRTKSVVTPKMIAMAQEKIVELGYESSIVRKFATFKDIPVDEVLFTSTKDTVSTSVFDDMIVEANRKAPKKMSKVEPISIDKFIETVLPTCKKIELLFESRLKSNLMTLVAPVHETAKTMFKWNNNISWSYNGDVTDSIKDRVKHFGGDVEGDLRVSLAWHSPCDLDLSCKEPNGKTIYYHAKKSSYSGGYLDLDMNGLDKKDSDNPVENIIFKDKKYIKEGVYKFIVHNYNARKADNGGFSIQVEFDGKTQTFNYDRHFANNEKIIAFSVKWDGKNFEIVDTWNKFTSSTNAKEEVWSINTNEFVPVNFVMNSPNFWSNNESGNKHTFFIIDGCKNSEPVRGFFNEYLNSELTEHRKVLEILGSKTKAEVVENQLSGIGFSSTVRNKVTLRVTGKTQRIFEVQI